MTNFIHINNFIDDSVIKYYLNCSTAYKEHDSKVGSRVGKDKKNRKDIYFNRNNCGMLDNVIFNDKYETFKATFNIDIKYRETYKLGTYYDVDKGFYTSHTDTQGGMEHRKLSIVICLSSDNDYQGGLFKFIDLNKSFKFDKGDAIIFDSNLLHCVEPVVSGKRQVLVSFIWDEYGEQLRIQKSKNPTSNYTPSINKFHPTIISHDSKSIDVNTKYISIIPADSGPGNQIIGIKESLILSSLLNRTCIIPPIREHYLKSNTVYYNFNDIFHLNNSRALIDDVKSNFINNGKIQTMYSIYPRAHDKQLKHELLLHFKYNNILLSNRRIHTTDSISELSNINDNILMIRHLFNNICISECGINGCFTCNLNTQFSDMYKQICSEFDYSNTIKYIGNSFINDNLCNDYIAIHIRLPDVFGKNTLSELTNSQYNDSILFKLISYIKQKFNKPIFIASNNINFIKQLNIEFINYSDKHVHSSFIDQYICCKSTIFCYLNLNSSFCNNNHNRSTYASFIIDYRLYLENKEPQNNINLHTILM